MPKRKVVKRKQYHFLLPIALVFLVTFGWLTYNKLVSPVGINRVATMEVGGQDWGRATDSGTRQIVPTNTPTPIPSTTPTPTPTAPKSGISSFTASKPCGPTEYLSISFTCKDGRVKEIASNTCTYIIGAMKTAQTTCGGSQ